MIFDTLQYVDGAGATQEIALQLANIASNRPAVNATATVQTFSARQIAAALGMKRQRGAMAFARRNAGYT